jgi:hypothetical protein
LLSTSFPATVFSNFNLGDIGFIAMGALGSGAVGYATGLPRRNAHAIFFTIVGGFAGVVAGYQSSHKRLTGFEKK